MVDFSTVLPEIVTPETTLLLAMEPMLIPWPPEQKLSENVMLEPLLTARQSSWFLQDEPEEMLVLILGESLSKRTSDGQVGCADIEAVRVVTECLAIVSERIAISVVDADTYNRVNTCMH